MNNLYNLESVEFFEYMENMKRKLTQNNKDYKELLDEIEKIKNKFPNVRGVLEDEKICEMTLDEVKALLKSINLWKDCLRIEEYETFMLGSKELYYYLKKIGII